MLPTLNLSLLSTAISAEGSENNALFSMGSDDSSKGENPFAALLEQLGLNDEGPLNEQDLTAVLTALQEEIGESLPLSEALKSDGSTELFDIAIDPNSLSQITGEFIAEGEATENPERMTGNELLAYLMANAGMISDDIPQSVNAESELSTLEELVVPTEASDESSVDLDQSEELPLLLNVSQSADDETSGSSLPEGELGLDSEESTLTNAVNDFDADVAMSFNDEGLLMTDEATSTEEGEDPAAVLSQVKGIEEASGVTAASQVGKTSIDNKPAVQSMDALETEATNDDVLENKLEVGKGAKEILADAKALDPKAVLPDEKVAPSKTEVLGTLGSEGSDSTAQKTSQTTERVLNANLTLNSGANAEPVIEEPLAKTVFEPSNPISKSSTARPMAETLVQQSVNDQLSRPMKLALASQALAERIQTMVAGDLKQAIIRLDPPELGALELRVQVQQEQTQVQIVTSNSQVREALEQHSARLREALAEQGLNLSNLDVSDQQTGDQGGAQSGGSGGLGNESDGEDVPELELNKVVSGQGVVDHYV